MRVRAASLLSTRAEPCGWKCRAALPAAPPVILRSAATKNLVRTAYRFVLDGRCALRGTVFLLVQKDGEERARQGEGLFTKPPFSLDPHPPKIVTVARLADARARRLAPLDARRAVRRGMSDGASRCPVCHSEERSDEESKCKFATRFFASLRMTGGVVSAYQQADVLCWPSSDISRCTAIARAEQSEAARTVSVRRGWKTNFGGWDSKGKGGFVKSPSLWRAFLPLLSARAERRGPRRA